MQGILLFIQTDLLKYRGAVFLSIEWVFLSRACRRCGMVEARDDEACEINCDPILGILAFSRIAGRANVDRGRSLGRTAIWDERRDFSHGNVASHIGI